MSFKSAQNASTHASTLILVQVAFLRARNRLSQLHYPRLCRRTLLPRSCRLSQKPFRRQALEPMYVARQLCRIPNTIWVNNDRKWICIYSLNVVMPQLKKVLVDTLLLREHTTGSTTVAYCRGKHSSKWVKRILSNQNRNKNDIGSCFHFIGPTYLDKSLIGERVSDNSSLACTFNNCYCKTFFIFGHSCVLLSIFCVLQKQSKGIKCQNISR